MATFAAFSSKLAEKKMVEDMLAANLRGLQATCDDRVRAEHQTKFPKSKITNLYKMREKVDFTAIFDPLKAEADALLSQHDAAIARIESDLALIAGVLSPVETPDMMQHAVSLSNSYRTQGFGANTYARGEAQRIADSATRAGLKAEVRVINSGRTGGQYPMYWEDYGVFVNTDVTGWEIVLRRPALSVRDWVKSCWKNGTNPRVMNPWLPHDFEEKHGIAYDGSDIQTDGQHSVSAAGPDAANGMALAA